MRLITRADFDGLVCGALLLEAKIIDSWMFVHPNDVRNGLVSVTENDCLANVPYVEGCGLWFDHHFSEHERMDAGRKFNGECRLAPSCARIIYDYYGGHDRFPRFDEMISAVDKVDSGSLTRDEIENPRGWVMIGFIMDPGTGLGRWHDFTISNFQLLDKLLYACAEKRTSEILQMPDVQERVKVYKEQTELFKDMISEYTYANGNVIITDLRGVEPIYTGNRFLIYCMYPQQNISIWMTSGKNGRGCTAEIGHSVINRSSSVNVGKFMAKYGGGGHKSIGLCQMSPERMDIDLPKMIRELCEMSNNGKK